MNSLSMHRFLPIAILYFFLNGLFLPLGLLYTSLLAPVFIIWLWKYPAINYLWVFFLVSIPYAVIHFLNGVNPLVYLKSYFLLFTVFVFCVSFFQFLKIVKDLPSLFKSLTILNAFMVVIALITLLIPVLQPVLWYISEFTTGSGKVFRLKMFTYEASYYSTLLVPIVLYYYLKMLFFRIPNKAFTFLLLTIPLLLSLSFGIILGLILTMTILFLSDIKLFTLKSRFPSYFISTLLFFAIIFIILLQVYPDNALFIRMANIFEGKDTSFRGRTFDSFFLAWKVASQKSIIFGAGPGQTKLLGLDFFKDFYNYNEFTEEMISIPNSIGDTLATFGLLGVVIRLCVQVYFFFKTKVYLNFYRLALFIFVFIYQFTGSYITNIAEYVIWIMAFTPSLFPEFNKHNVYIFNRRPLQASEL